MEEGALWPPDCILSPLRAWHTLCSLLKAHQFTDLIGAQRYYLDNPVPQWKRYVFYSLFNSILTAPSWGIQNLSLHFTNVWTKKLSHSPTSKNENTPAWALWRGVTQGLHLPTNGLPLHPPPRATLLCPWHWFSHCSEASPHFKVCRWSEFHSFSFCSPVTSVTLGWGPSLMELLTILKQHIGPIL